MASVQDRLAFLDGLEARVVLLEQLVSQLRSSPQISDLEDQLSNTDERQWSLKCRVDRLDQWVPFLQRLWAWWFGR
jgi:6-phosphogluconate dehydrogenase (decarboxylating)